MSITAPSGITARFRSTDDQVTYKQVIAFTDGGSPLVLHGIRLGDVEEFREDLGRLDALYLEAEEEPD